MSSIEKEISSAEMTAYWRSLFPQLSKDTLSIKLASQAGIEKATAFETKFSYPLIGRKVSVRAGFILENIIRLLSTGKYDSCISFASGFSFLTHVAAQELAEKGINNITFIDSDLPNMAAERKKRIEKLPNEILPQNHSKNIKIVPLDLELACQKNQTLQELFPHCKRPLFIIEGVIYFLSQACVKWIIDNTANYEHSALIFDYWPENGVEESACFKRVVDSLKGFIPENIKSFWMMDNIQQLKHSFSRVEDYKISDIEHRMSKENKEPPQFNNQQEFFPVKFIVAEK
jgi:hypothetical protein